MKKLINKLYSQQKKQFLKKIIGTDQKLRLSIFKSNKNIYTQLINDITGITIVSCSTIDKNFKETLIGSYNKKDIAFKVGVNLANKAIKKNIYTIIFDQKQLYFSSCIKNLIDGIKSSGLSF
jgi:large subunit ribosomal protein L18